MISHGQEKNKKIELRILPGGRIESDWWTPEVGDLICALCGKCQGWRTEEKPIDCLAGNPWCG